MWFNAACFASLLLAVNGLNSFDTRFFIEYFKHRDVTLLCVLDCEDDYWLSNFAKEAAKSLLLVSALKTSEGIAVNYSTKVGKCLQQEYASIGVIIDPACSKFEHVMTYASENTLLDSKHKWLVFLDETINISNIPHLPVTNHTCGIANTLRVLGDLNISVDCDITIATKTDSNFVPTASFDYQLHEIYNFGKIQGGGLIIKRAAGKWECNKHPNISMNTNLNEYKYYRRWNFHQWPMRMINVVSHAPKDFDPKLLTTQYPTPGVATVTKTPAIILEVISEIHNLRFVHSTCDRWLGDFSANQSRNVVASSLHYKLQDISSVIRFMSDNFDKIDVIHPPLTSIETRYYYRIPTHGAGKFENQFLRPLSAGAWLCAVAVVTLCAVMLLLSAKLEGRPAWGQYAVFSVIASFSQQFFDDSNVDTGYKSSARKLTIFVTGLSCVLVYNYYTSSVVSWLLNGPPPSINSLQELLESNLKLVFEDIGYTRSWIQTPTYYYNKRNAKIEDELRKKKVFNNIKGTPLLVTLEKGIEMLKEGGYAFHTEVDSADRLISQSFTQSELCELGSLQSMNQALLYVCVQKSSPYREFLNWSLMRLLERGIVRCIQHRTRSPSVRCEGSSPRALALGGAAPAFILLLGGYLLAIVMMLVERVIWRYKENLKLQIFHH